MNENIAKDLRILREKTPLIHNITNYVVMNSTANALLAIGAAPVMAHAREEVREMVSLASALVVNIGTLSPGWVEAMHMAMETAREYSIPIILDPVGAGATPYRTDTVHQLIRTAVPTIIRGNASEILALYSSEHGARGVDSQHSTDSAEEAATHLSKQLRCVISVSGATDRVVDGDRTVLVRNGHPLMGRITGMGCTASALTAAFAAIDPLAFDAACYAAVVMGIAGEVAAETAPGPASLQVAFLDALYQLDEPALNRANVEEL